MAHTKPRYLDLAFDVGDLCPRSINPPRACDGARDDKSNVRRHRSCRTDCVTVTRRHAEVASGKVLADGGSGDTSRCRGSPGHYSK